MASDPALVEHLPRADALHRGVGGGGLTGGTGTLGRQVVSRLRDAGREVRVLWVPLARSNRRQAGEALCGDPEDVLSTDPKLLVKGGM